ncbi:MAG: hypothetical protein SVM79_09070, partial [Chloroflexota bacterium]|nr:hypothetical protein [Chloroflexota bacterium]
YLKQYGNALEMRQLGWPILAAVLISIPAILIRPQGEMLIVVYTVLSVLYVAFLWLVGTIEYQEKQIITQFARNILCRVTRG